MFVRGNDTLRGPTKDVPHLVEADPYNSFTRDRHFLPVDHSRRVDSLERTSRSIVALPKVCAVPEPRTEDQQRRRRISRRLGEIAAILVAYLKRSKRTIVLSLRR